MSNVPINVHLKCNNNKRWNAQTSFCKGFHWANNQEAQRSCLNVKTGLKPAQLNRGQRRLHTCFQEQAGWRPRLRTTKTTSWFLLSFVHMCVHVLLKILGGGWDYWANTCALPLRHNNGRLRRRNWSRSISCSSENWVVRNICSERLILDCLELS